MHLRVSTLASRFPHHHRPCACADCDFFIQLLHEPAEPPAQKVANKKDGKAGRKGSKPGAPPAPAGSE